MEKHESNQYSLYRISNYLIKGINGKPIKGWWKERVLRILITTFSLVILSLLYLYIRENLSIYELDGELLAIQNLISFMTCFSFIFALLCSLMNYIYYRQSKDKFFENMFQVISKSLLLFMGLIGNDFTLAIVFLFYLAIIVWKWISVIYWIIEVDHYAKLKEGLNRFEVVLCFGVNDIGYQGKDGQTEMSLMVKNKNDVYK